MEHYGTLEAATAYHILRGNTAWGEGDDASRTAALIRASEALDGRYARDFSGYKLTSEQPRQWPRRDAFDFCSQLPLGAVIPIGIINASYALALIEKLTPGSLSPAITYGRLTRSEAAGPANRSFFGPQDLGLTGAAALQAFRPTITAAEDQLGCYLKSHTTYWGAMVV